MNALRQQKIFTMFFAFGLLASIFYLFILHKSIFRLKNETDLIIQDITECRNLVNAEIRQEQQAIISLEEKIVSLSQVKIVTENLGKCLTVEDTSRILSSEVNRLFCKEEATVILYLFHSRTGELGISASQKGQMRVNLKSKKGDVFDKWIVKIMQPLLVEDTHNDYRFDMDKIEQDEPRQIRSLISVPLMVGHKAIGILRVDAPKEKYFSAEDLRFLVTIGDIGAVAMENAQLYEHLEALAIKDSLTGLFLRRHLLDRLAEEISRHIRRHEEMSIVMLDLDHFKKYNDKFGHIAGDIVLKTVADKLLEIFKSDGNLVCRYGGEEFAVVLPNCDKKKAYELTEEFRKALSETPVTLRREKTTITVSAGIASLLEDAQVKDELIHKADKALYEAKMKGRNRICIAAT
jgi:diguanylate cyclase (GGDEF)-like protein